ncbi:MULTISPECIES: hypothetical protein [Mycobacterium]|jgi:hypothetical protein|uniref:hypothetical protein n=1 Tax=Mycobacterium TaxID=1763 RepID=UPI001EE1BE87|nr:MULTISPECIES: hypothetical protein [Mycobacterium]BDE17312.1 hypothetical protein MKCMC460_61720 [Mycobacterium sp. 20KCMC460]GLB93013.1 hypothetical protein SRL2020130_58300 [Mycobacterium kiyosense]GLB99292.1 hypothetical protein SRL2020226_60680 [Mycobacterium kiyosense]GLC04154.1 hypothetical protein SRL2020400_47450 [Mycobacterium kiyosense]GLC16893.1 hypothetical protein SRL2020448_54960 [Mycobacterium kiyosense]
MRWDQGRETVEALIADKRIEQVQPSRAAADRLLDQARSHLESAAQIADSDAVGAYALVYDAARKALAAVLENEGLRATSRGGHIAVLEAVRAQLEPPLGGKLMPFDRMRRRRNVIEYSPEGSVVADDVREDAGKAQVIADTAAQVLDQMSPYR